MIQSTGFRVVRAVLLAAFAVYFFLPLYAMLDFSIRGKGEFEGTLTFEYYQELFRDEDLRQAIFSSLLLAVLTVLLMVVLLVPTMIWVRLRVPKLSRTRRVPLPAAADGAAAGDRGRHPQRLRLGQLPARRPRPRCWCSST